MTNEATSSQAEPPASDLPRRALPIAARLSIDLLIAALVPLAVVAWVSARHSARELERVAQRDASLLAAATAARIDQLLVDSSHASAMLAADDSINRMLVDRDDPLARAAVQRVLSAKTVTNPDHASAFVIGTDGVGVASTNAANVGQDLSFREYFRTARDGRSYGSEILIGKTTREPGVYFSTPVHYRAPDAAPGDLNTDAPPLGVVVIKLRGERLSEMVGDVRIGERGFAVLVDSFGVVTAQPAEARAGVDWLYRSLGPLSDEELAKIDTQITYSLPTIEHAGMPELLSVLRQSGSTGSTTFVFPRAGSSESEGEMWVAGWAPLSQRRWKVIALEPRSQAMAESAALVRHQAVIALIVACVAGALALWRAKGIVRPLLGVSAAAEQLAKGDFAARAPVVKDDEVGRLATSFNQMVPQLRERIDLQQSLAVAMDVQQSLLPSADPVVEGLQIAGRSTYCDQTGGDYFDFLQVARLEAGVRAEGPPEAGRSVNAASEGDDGTLIVVGDVMGHGVAAALLMASVRAALRTRAREAGSLGKLMRQINLVLAGDSHGRFVTMALLVVELDRSGERRARWASAGHDPTIVYHGDRDEFDELPGGDIPLGIDADVDYEEYRREGFRAGDVLVIGTDGIWEMVNESHEQFGKDRLRDVIRECRGRSAEETAQVLEDRLKIFRGTVSPKDDVTFVVIRFV